MINIPPESYIHRDCYNPWKATVNIGKYTSIASGLRLITSTHPSISHNTVSNFPFYGVFRRYKKIKVDYPSAPQTGTVNIGNDVWIGDGVSLIGEITIGDGAIIGASSVVAKDVPPYAIVVGNPIRINRFRFTDEQIAKLLKIKWWLWPEEDIIKSLPDMKDINIFLSKYGSEGIVGEVSKT
jgi:hypothetical protein